MFKPIGQVRTQAEAQAIREALEGVEGWVEILREYEEGLNGLEGFYHLILVATWTKWEKRSGKPFGQTAPAPKSGHPSGAASRNRGLRLPITP
ncbi:MAG: hypothetical protein ACUVUP_05405 [Thermaceae bacterium]